jgi:hypothetical protein
MQYIQTVFHAHELTWTYLPPEGYLLFIFMSWRVFVLYLQIWHAQEEITTNVSHAIPALFSIPTPEASGSILAPTASGEVSYLNEYLSLHLPVRPVQQEEEAAATVIDSCNPLTFHYDSQCINISLSCRLLEKQSRIFLISEYGREGQCLKNLCLLATGKALRAKFSSTMTLREARLVC